MTTTIPSLKSRSPGGIQEMIAIAVPMVISSASETIMMFTDRLFLSRLGAEYMSAGLGGHLTAFMMTTFFMGLTGYSTALAAQYLGSGRKNQCAVVLAQALIITAIAFPVILACRPLGHMSFRLARIAPTQLVLQQQYFNIMIWGTVLTLARHCFSSFFSGIGRTRIVMLAAFTAMLANVAGNYALIFGHWGLPALGIAGSAYGTVFGSACGLAVLITGYLLPANRAEFGIAASLRFDRQVMSKLVRFGYPAGIEFFMNILAFNLLILLFHSRGLEAAAAVTVVLQWDMVSFVPLIGMNIGVTSLVGRYMGAGRPDIAHKATLSGLKLALTYACCTLVAFSCFPQPLVAMFRAHGDSTVFDHAQPIAVHMLRLTSIYVLADAVNLVFSGALRGAGDTLWAMTISIARHWVLVPTLAVLLFIFHVRIETAWLVLVTVILAFSSVFYFRYRSGAWKKIRVLHAADAAH
jgi:multidrug resistance protein, MATE family